MMYKRTRGLFSLLFVMALGLVFFTAGSAQAAMPTGVISYWQLEEAAAPYVDEVGAHNGACGPACPVQGAGRVNFGQEFLRVDTTGIDILDDADFDWAVDQSFSIELWMKPVIGITVLGDTVGDREVLIGRTTAGPATQWFLGVEALPANKGFVLFQLVTNGGTETITLTGTTAVNVANAATDDWYHIVGVRDVDDPMDKELRIYVNGVLEDSEADTFTDGFDALTELNLGRLDINPFFNFNGTLDQVVIYDRVLTATEIDDHYEKGLQGLGIEEDLPTPTPPSPSNGGGGGGGCFISTTVEK